MKRPAGAVIMGGRSTRMGEDKALLVDPVTREPFWRLQVERLRSIDLDPVLVSTHSRRGLPGVEELPDRFSDCGPMGGLVTCLASDRVGSWLVVLAVDLPGVEAPLLQRLIDEAGPYGAIYERDGRFEPLVACYHRDLLPALEGRLARGDFRLQSWISAEVASGRIKRLVLSPDASHRLANLNTTGDYEAYCQWRKRSQWIEEKS
ncbi:MAG: molybdenum cofactor guanylyltransferase [Verrucomicrobiota bacterium]